MLYCPIKTKGACFQLKKLTKNGTVFLLSILNMKVVCIAEKEV